MQAPNPNPAPIVITADNATGEGATTQKARSKQSASFHLFT